MYCKILPTYLPKLFHKINLQNEALKYFNFSHENPMKTIDNQINLISMINHPYTFGDFLNDRQILWKDFENSEKMIHLGIDINNLKADDPVSVPCDAEVFHSFTDYSKFNGWGFRIILKMQEEYLGCKFLLYGHLKPDKLLSIGQSFKKGDIVGYIGNETENGGWFVHLHVQLIKEKMIKDYSDNLNLLDGYLLDDKIDPNEYTADPTHLVFHD